MTEEVKENLEEKKGFKMPKMNVWMITSIVLVIILIGVLIFFGTGAAGMIISDNILSAEDAAKTAILWMSSYLEAAGADADLTLINVTEENDVYKFTVKMSTSQGEQESIHYVSKDGKLFFPQAILTSEIIQKPEESEQSPQQPEEIPKTNKPEVHAFVMSYCPYGLQFMKAYIPVMELLGDKADLELNFVHYIMHEKKEIDENTRMYCIQKEQNNKFTNYLRCFVEKDDWEACVDQVGIDKTKLEACIDATDEQFNITGLYEDKSTWSGGRFPLYPVDDVLAQQFGVRGSPTFVVNGKTLSVQRSAEAIKQAICSAFNTPPSECEQTLSATAESPGIGPMGSGNPSDNPSATCG